MSAGSQQAEEGENLVRRMTRRGFLTRLGPWVAGLSATASALGVRAVPNLSAIPVGWVSGQPTLTICRYRFPQSVGWWGYVLKGKDQVVALIDLAGRTVPWTHPAALRQLAGPGVGRVP